VSKSKLNYVSKRGLTLIELVMVLVILTALAALIVPQVDYIRRTSDKASASFIMEQVVENVGMYRTVTGGYPGKLDSLVDDSGSTSAANLSSNVDAKADLVKLAGQEFDSLTKIGIDTVMLHDPNGTIYRNFPGNSGNLEAAVGSGGQQDFWVIVDGNIIDSVYPGASTNPTGVFPNLVDASTSGGGHIALDANKTARIVVLGVGPSNDAVGKTMVSAPAYQGIDGLKEYNRFLAMFAVYNGFGKTKRAQLKGALDSTMDFLNQELIETTENNLE